MSSLRLNSLRSLAPELSSALKDFQTSGAKFRILQTIHPTNNSIAREPKTNPQSSESPRTLFILDSSFNPPSIAHKSLAQSALHKASCHSFPKPHRLLLLFAVTNADKAPSPAAFEHRLAMMSLFASDLLESLKADSETYVDVPVDVGVTTVPYYTDKSAAIETEGLQWYPSRPAHVHLVGFDTLKRFFAAKYYPKFDPPFSALEPYFGHGHQLRVTLRPDEGSESIDQQKAFVQGIENGDLEKDGGRREWAKQTTLVPPNPRAGVSSTKIRQAATRQDWAEVSQLCTSRVAEYVQAERLYEDDDRGARMA